jgi:hypothetical protein
MCWWVGMMLCASGISLRAHLLAVWLCCWKCILRHLHNWAIIRSFDARKFVQILVCWYIVSTRGSHDCKDSEETTYTTCILFDFHVFRFGILCNSWLCWFKKAVISVFLMLDFKILHHCGWWFESCGMLCWVGWTSQCNILEYLNLQCYWWCWTTIVSCDTKDWDITSI